MTLEYSSSQFLAQCIQYIIYYNKFKNPDGMLFWSFLLWHINREVEEGWCSLQFLLKKPAIGNKASHVQCTLGISTHISVYCWQKCKCMSHQNFCRTFQWKKANKGFSYNIPGLLSWTHILCCATILSNLADKKWTCCSAREPWTTWSAQSFQSEQVSQLR